ncbi:MAG: hypothetical protein RL317_1148 [Pseudomonadota bacterium]|jgi:polysaccharide export outer membrane protein
MFRFARALAALLVLATPNWAAAQSPDISAFQSPPHVPETGTAMSVQSAAGPVQPDVTANQGYMLGPEDVIEVSVVGQPEFTTKAKVEADGSIALPFIGKQQVAGQTPLGLSAAITSRLTAGGFYTNPIAAVNILSYASRYVIVLGEVAQPGLQPVNRSYRVSEIIARAGGIKATGASHIILRRADGSDWKLDFRQIATGSDAQDPVVFPGDKLFVPQAETFYIYGQVNAPGTFALQDDMTVRMALARAGGLTALGSQKRVQVYRQGKASKVPLETLVRPGDVIVVGERMF